MLTNEILAVLKKSNSSPFLFIGSGFSRRYIGLEDWGNLLRKFCEDLEMPFEYYKSTANGDLPSTASLIALDFHKVFWTSPKYETLMKKYKKYLSTQESSLKCSIAHYLKSLSLQGVRNEEYVQEIQLLHNLNVDGIITTNWDTLLEEIFPDYKVYIGQDGLLFSNPQSIGEIYKIHGCITDPKSMILTEADYSSYKNRNAYLAAKLITLFVEHPIIFIGYSLSDANIIDLLRSIVYCLGKEKINQLYDNLIFVKRDRANEGDAVYQSHIIIDDIQLPVTIIRSKDFIPIYSAINKTKRKVPTRIIRYFKEQFYEFVHSDPSATPKDKVCVIDFENIEKKEDVQFVIGHGVIDKYQSIGYKGLNAKDIIEDVIVKDKGLNAKEIIEKSVGDMRGNIPIFKYLVGCEITSHEEYKKSNFNLDHLIKQPIQYATNAYRQNYMTNAFNMGLIEVINKFPAEKVCIYIPFMNIKETELDTLQDFLSTNYNAFMKNENSYRTHYRKAVCCYDFYRFGWKYV